MCRVLQARRALLGPDAPPLPVLGPHYLTRALKGWSELQPLGYHFIDIRQTLHPSQSHALYTRQVCCQPCSRLLTGRTSIRWGSGPLRSQPRVHCRKRQHLHAGLSAKPAKPTPGPLVNLQRSAVQDSQQVLLDDLMRDMGLTLLRSFFVEHCSQAFGLALQVIPCEHMTAHSCCCSPDWAAGLQGRHLRAAARRVHVDRSLPLQGTAKGSSKASWKLAFSGDCRPCQAVITNAKDADLLIHEVGPLSLHVHLRGAGTCGGHHQRIEGCVI